MIASMADRITLHIVDPVTRVRAEIASVVFDLGYHAEVYANIAEVTERPPRSGILIMRDDPLLGGIEGLVRKLSDKGVWLPIIATGDDPGPHEVVSAMKAGALDYIQMPIDHARLDMTLGKLSGEAETYARSRRRMIEARDRIANLSKREGEVLDWLARGCSNKVIARELAISPRTVEIHRANMMTKLGARHAAEAVRVKLEAQIEIAPGIAS